MGRSNLIPITKIYDIYPKYTYSEGVKKFMDEIVDIDRANVYTKDEVIAMLTELMTEIEKQEYTTYYLEDEDACGFNYGITASTGFIEEKIEELKK